LDAYDYCKYLVETWPNRWTGSAGERASGDWMEGELARMGYETRQVRFDCPGWQYDGEEFYLAGRRLQAGAQFYSVGCDVAGPIAVVTPDGQGGFQGEAKGKVALLRETQTKDVNDRNKLLEALEAAGAKAAVIVSEYRDTYSTKMFRDPESRLPALGVSGAVGEELYASTGKEARVVIRARQTSSSTGSVLGQRGPAAGPVLMVCAHHEASPGAPGAYDNASGIGVVLDLAQRFAKARLGALLRFAGFGGHEFGTFGSKAYVRDYEDEARQIKRLLMFDGVGVKGAALSLTAWGGKEMVAGVRAFAAGRPGVRFEAGKGPALGDAGSFWAIGTESVWVSVSDWSKAAPFHSPLDDMRWIGREALAEAVEIGVAMLNEWMRELGAR
jgi:Iap family predicted aminopeptidase